MGNETSSPEGTKKSGVFESPVILPNPDKELDDGGVYKGDTTSDRIRKVSEILRRSLEMDVEENDVRNCDVVLHSLEENGGDISPHSPTFRSSVTIHLTPCVKYLEPTDTESSSKENIDIKPNDRPSHDEERSTGENDQVHDQNIDKAISNSCMSSAEVPLCNGDISAMKGSEVMIVADDEGREEVVTVTRAHYQRGNSNIDEYIEKARFFALKTNGFSPGVSDSDDKLDGNVYCDGNNKTDNEEIDQVESEEMLTLCSKPDQQNDENAAVVEEAIIPSNTVNVHVENQIVDNKENVKENLKCISDKTYDRDNLETKVISEIIKKEEIQRQTSAEEEKERSKRKSPLSKFGVKFNDAWKSIKPRRKESMEKSKTRVAGAYAAEHDFTVNHTSPTYEKSSFQWEEPQRTKVTILQTNGISYEGATQKAHAICSEYACVTRKTGSPEIIEVTPETIEDTESESDSDLDIDTDLIMKSTASRVEAEDLGPVYVGLIVKDVKDEEGHTDVENDTENTNDTTHALTATDDEDETIRDAIEHNNLIRTGENHINAEVDLNNVSDSRDQEVVNESVDTKTAETNTTVHEKGQECGHKSPSPTKVKKRNSLLKYLLHRESPKKSKKKGKDPHVDKGSAQGASASLNIKTKSEAVSSEEQQTDASHGENNEPKLRYVECREKEICAADDADKKPVCSSNSSDSEFDDIDLNSTSETQSDLNVDNTKLEESFSKEEINCNGEEIDINESEKDITIESADFNPTPMVDEIEGKATLSHDQEKSVLSDSGISNYAVNDSHLTDYLDNNNMEVSVQVLENSEKHPSEEIQASVIDVTCTDDNVNLTDNHDATDMNRRQEKRKLYDEEDESLELQGTSRAHTEGGPAASASTKSSPIRKKKKKRTNSLSAKISDFFGVAEFRRRISTSSNKSDKSPQEEKNIWPRDEKIEERKHSGSSIHEHVETKTIGADVTCSEINEEIIPERSLEAKSMPVLNIEHSREGEDKTSSEKTREKARGKGKGRRPLKSSFLESLGLHTNKAKTRPFISNPIRQGNRRSLFDEEIPIDVDQDLHIISLSDDENDADTKSQNIKDRLQNEAKKSEDGKAIEVTNLTVENDIQLPAIENESILENSKSVLEKCAAEGSPSNEANSEEISPKEGFRNVDFETTAEENSVEEGLSNIEVDTEYVTNPLEKRSPNVEVEIKSEKTALEKGPPNIEVEIISEKYSVEERSPNIEVEIKSEKNSLEERPSNIEVEIKSEKNSLREGPPNIEVDIESEKNSLEEGPPNIEAEIKPDKKSLEEGLRKIEVDIESEKKVLEDLHPNIEVKSNSESDFLEEGTPSVAIETKYEDHSLDEKHTSVEVSANSEDNSLDTANMRINVTSPLSSSESRDESCDRSESGTDTSFHPEIKLSPGEYVSIKQISENAEDTQNVTDSMKFDQDDSESGPKVEPKTLTPQINQHGIKEDTNAAQVCETKVKLAAKISEPEVRPLESDIEASKEITVENEIESKLQEVTSDMTDPEEVKLSELDTEIQLEALPVAHEMDEKDIAVNGVNMFTEMANKEKVEDEQNVEEILSANINATKTAEKCLNACNDEVNPPDDENDSKDIENETSVDKKSDVDAFNDSENATTLTTPLITESVNDCQRNNNKMEHSSLSSKENHIVSKCEEPSKLEASCVNCVECENNRDLPNASRNHITIEATIETPPVSSELDLCEMRDPDTTERCQEIGGDPLCNDAEYDSIDMEDERTVAIENPNYCDTCQAEYKSPLDKVDDLHSEVQVDVSGDNTHNSMTLPSIPSSAEERKSSSARSASMEELTVHASHIYEEIEKKRPIIYRRFSDKTDNKKVICTSPDPEGKKVKKKKSRSSSFSEFFRNPTKYKMPVWRNKKSKEMLEDKS